MKDQMERNSADITSLGARGSWCAFQDSWTSVRTITYDRLTHSDTNMNVGSPLNRYTGINSHKCYYFLVIDICHISGIFTVPVSGAWRISYSLQSSGRGVALIRDEKNIAVLYKNGNSLQGTQYYSASSDGWVASTGGRVVNMEANAGDRIDLRATRIDDIFWDILFCAEFIPKL